jgi:DnaA family protein
MSAQLALNLRLRESASFANFHSAHNAEAVDCLRRALDALATATPAERVIYLWGPTGSGRSHLLQAACHHAQARAANYSYVPLHDAIHLSPATLDDLDSAPLVCLDDMQAIAGKRLWEEAVFALAERLRARDGLLVAAADAPPTQLALTLPDLVTRLGWGPVFPLHALDDEEKIAALQLRASRLGLELPPEVARYVLARYPRDMHSLFAWLDRADRQSLAAQRKLTIPFVRGLEGG